MCTRCRAGVNLGFAIGANAQYCWTGSGRLRRLALLRRYEGRARGHFGVQFHYRCAAETFHKIGLAIRTRNLGLKLINRSRS